MIVFPTWTEHGNDQLGSGWYFTTDREEGERYALATRDGLPKLGGDDRPTLHVVDLQVARPLGADEHGTITLAQAKCIIGAAPDLDVALENWGDIGMTSRDRLIGEAARAYSGEEVPLLKMLNALSADFFPGAIAQFNRSVREVLGYDGVVAQLEDRCHLVAWFPEQITIVDTVPVVAPTRGARP